MRIVVVDTETTGLNPMRHDLIQLCIMALKLDFTPDKGIPPFYALIKPKSYPVGEEGLQEYLNEIKPAMDKNKLSMKKILENGFDQAKAMDLFEKWWAIAGHGEQLFPLCQNYSHDAAFLRQFMGPISFSHYFSYYPRDTFSTAQFLNDQAMAQGAKIPYPNGLSLGKLCIAHGIDLIGAHDAYFDCIATAEVYRQQVMWVHINKRTTEDMTGVV